MTVIQQVMFRRRLRGRRFEKRLKVLAVMAGSFCFGFVLAFVLTGG